MSQLIQNFFLELITNYEMDIIPGTDNIAHEYIYSDNYYPQYKVLYSELITQLTISLILLMVIFILIGIFINVKDGSKIIPSFAYFLHIYTTPYLVWLLFPYYILVILFSGFGIFVHYSHYLGMLYTITLMMLLFKNYNYLEKFFSYTIWFLLSGLSLIYLYIVVKTGNIYIITQDDILAIIVLLCVFSIFGSLFLFILLEPAYNEIIRKIYEGLKFAVFALITIILLIYLMEQGYDYIYVILIISLLFMVSLIPYIMLDNIILNFIQDTNKKNENFFTISMAIILIKLRFILNIIFPDQFDIYSFIILFIFISILSKLLDRKLTLVSFFIILLVCPLSILLFNIYIFPIFILPLLIYSFDIIGFIIGELVNYFGLSWVINFLDQVLRNDIMYCDGLNPDEYTTFLNMYYNERWMDHRFSLFAKDIVNNSFNNDNYIPYVNGTRTHFTVKEIYNWTSLYLITKEQLSANTYDHVNFFHILYEYKHIKLRMGFSVNDSTRELEDFVSNYNSHYKYHMNLGFNSERPAHWYKTEPGKLEDFPKIIGKHMEFAQKRQQADMVLLGYILNLQSPSPFLNGSQEWVELNEIWNKPWESAYFKSNQRTYTTLAAFAHSQVENGIFRDTKDILNNKEIISILKEQKDRDGNTFYSKIVSLANREQSFMEKPEWERDKIHMLEFPKGLIREINIKISKSKE